MSEIIMDTTFSRFVNQILDYRAPSDGKAKEICDDPLQKRHFIKNVFVTYNATQNMLTKTRDYMMKKQMGTVDGIVIHSTGNISMSASDFVNKYYNCFYVDEDESKCAHFIIDLNGDIYQLLPLSIRAIYDDISFLKSKDYISIMFCEAENKEDISKVYEKLVTLTAVLCRINQLKVENKTVSIRYEGEEVVKGPIKYWNNYAKDYYVDKFRNDVLQKVNELNEKGVPHLKLCENMSTRMNAIKVV